MQFSEIQLIKTLESLLEKYRELYKTFDPEGQIAVWGEWEEQAEGALEEAKSKPEYVFLSRVYEIALGDSAITKDYTPENVVEALGDHSNELNRFETFLVDFVNMEKGGLADAEELREAFDAFQSGATE